MRRDGLFGIRPGRPEGHHAVTDVLVHDAAVVVDGGADYGEILAQLFDEALGIRGLGHVREIHDVGEEQRELRRVASPGVLRCRFP